MASDNQPVGRDTPRPPAPRPPPPPLNSVLVDFALGGLSAAVSKTLAAPLERGLSRCMIHQLRIWWKLTLIFCSEIVAPVARRTDPQGMVDLTPPFVS